jgi:4-hydroxyproline epimerase
LTELASMSPSSDLAPRVQVIDTHTGGEPTRVVVAGGPDLGDGPLALRRDRFHVEFDAFRSAVVNEPRGSDVMVGAILVPPTDPSCVSGVIFFNNVGTLGMCGHGTIGVAVALRALGRIEPGLHRLETPVGVVPFTLEPDGRQVSLDNVPSYRSRAGVRVEVDGLGVITGDVAWGGNWFFLVHETDESIELSNVERLTDVAWRIRQALAGSGVTGDDGAEIDHVELFGPPSVAGAHSRNFVLCPGKAYDRSPCGTGTSAKLACLAADGKLAPGVVYRQESVIGSVFEGMIDGPLDDRGRARPRIRGAAYVTGEGSLRIDPDDPFAWGIRP